MSWKQKGVSANDLENGGCDRDVGERQSVNALNERVTQLLGNVYMLCSPKVDAQRSNLGGGRNTVRATYLGATGTATASGSGSATGTGSGTATASGSA